jgi:hypothetical protein
VSADTVYENIRTNVISSLEEVGVAVAVSDLDQVRAALTQGLIAMGGDPADAAHWRAVLVGFSTAWNTVTNHAGPIHQNVAVPLLITAKGVLSLCETPVSVASFLGLEPAPEPASSDESSPTPAPRRRWWRGGSTP